MRRWVARYYNVPLTDPRLNEYTDELLMIEMAFLKKEKPEWFAQERYTDPNYEDWVAQVTAEDSKVIQDNKERSARIISAPPVTDLNNTDEWEHVEINDADPPKD